MKKHIEVVAAIIRDGNSILATKRGYGEFLGMWEFPGGKMEIGESQEFALRREIKEELDVDIEIDEFLMTVKYEYESFYLTMHCYMVHLLESTIVLKEHADAKWLNKDNLDSVEWLPADVDIVKLLKEKLK